MRNPLYVISKGRFENCLTAKFLERDGVPFHLVVEPQERDEYAKRFGADRVLALPFSNLGLGSIPARNWVWEHAKATGALRHWILDDNIRKVMRTATQAGEHVRRCIRVDSNIAFTAVEDFAERYENVAIAGLNYATFLRAPSPPFYLNDRVYSCLLIRNDLTNRWRGRYNEDTDLCLQVLADGLCTVLVNAFVIEKVATMTMKGGNSAELYQGDGRLRMARSLERLWPGVVEVKRRFKRPQHVVDWSRFKTPLVLRAGQLTATGPNEYGMVLKTVTPSKT